MNHIEDSKSFCQSTIKHYKDKADHNKTEALTCFILVIICTLTTPLFITLGEGLWFGKIIPSVLSLIAAGTTAWLQQRKPQQLWVLYRSAQRELENHEVKHKYMVAEYEDVENPNKLLIKNVTEITSRTHNQWVHVVPSPDNLPVLGNNSTNTTTTSVSSGTGSHNSAKN